MMDLVDELAENLQILGLDVTANEILDAMASAGLVLKRPGPDDIDATTEFTARVLEEIDGIDS